MFSSFFASLKATLVLTFSFSFESSGMAGNTGGTGIVVVSGTIGTFDSMIERKMSHGSKLTRRVDCVEDIDAEEPKTTGLGEYIFPWANMFLGE